MKNLIVWLQSAPAGAITFLASILAALVALFVAVLTQWILGRRARTELLTKKLEELYLLINQASLESVERYKSALQMAKALVNKGPIKIGFQTPVDSLSLHKNILMYIRLYFPALTSAHQFVFKRNHDANMLLSKLNNEELPSPDEAQKVFGAYGNSLQLIEQEIIDNHKNLTARNFFPRRYKRAT